MEVQVVLRLFMRHLDAREPFDRATAWVHLSDISPKKERTHRSDRD